MCSRVKRGKGFNFPKFLAENYELGVTKACKDL